MSYSKSKYLLASWVVVSVFSMVLGIVLGASATPVSAVDEMTEAQTTIQTEEPSEVIESITTAPEVNDPKPIIEYISIGEYRLTAYCACEKCCGHWATIRPTDKDGKPIVFTASGNVAKQGVTVAADTNVLPFGTVLLIDCHEYIVQDRGGVIDGNRIDIYFESHEEALKFGVRYQEIFIKVVNDDA